MGKLLCQGHNGQQVLRLNSAYKGQKQTPAVNNNPSGIIPGHEHEATKAGRLEHNSQKGHPQHPNTPVSRTYVLMNRQHKLIITH